MRPGLDGFSSFDASRLASHNRSRGAFASAVQRFARDRVSIGVAQTDVIMSSNALLRDSASLAANPAAG
jgi:hypothetical protein